MNAEQINFLKKYGVAATVAYTGLTTTVIRNAANRLGVVIPSAAQIAENISTLYKQHKANS